MFNKYDSEHIIIVNEQDETIGSEAKLKVHQLGILHRAFSIFIFYINNDEKKLLLQKRNGLKYHSRNLWSNTCCGHPRAGEDIITAAHRRLYEEMHIQVDNLLFCGKFHYKKHLDNNLIENEIDHIFIGFYDDIDKEINYNPDEVQEYKWINIDDICNQYNDNQYNDLQFTVWFEDAKNIALSYLYQVN